ncbi:MAG: hypothetical protein ACRC0L_05775, partial [Angustibacter sp.]
GLLTNLADALTDDVLFFSRKEVAAGRYTEATQAIIFAALRMRIQLTDVEYAVLAECLVALSESTTTLDYLHVGQNFRPLYFEYAAGPAARAQGGSEGERSSADVPDPAAAELDDQALQRIAGLDGILGMWRAWRFPATQTSWPEPKACYLLELESATDLVAAQEQLYGPDADPEGPLWELYLTGNDLPQSQRAMQFTGQLVFAAAEEPDFKFADVFTGEPGPDGLPQEYEKLEDDALIGEMAEFLANGKPLMLADSEGEDLFDPSRGAVVPLHLRTNGEWIWSEASVYYLTHHRIAPPSEFRAVLADLLPSSGIAVSDTVLHQAASWLQAE